MEKELNLLHINVNEKVEKKSGLSYLSWTYAWGEILKKYPESTYRVLKFENNLPYIYDQETGYMVFTEVTINNITREMWLPVMNGANKAMKSVKYTYKTKYGNKEVDSATMFDINKTIMRCLVKNLAMFGLGLYIYSGEDLPESSDEEIREQALLKEKEKEKAKKHIIDLINSAKNREEAISIFKNNPLFQKDEEVLKALKQDKFKEKQTK